MPDWRLNIDICPPAEPTTAKVPQGVTATLVTSVPSPVSKAHLPAFFLPQNHVLAYLSPRWPVTMLSQPVAPLSDASAGPFFAAAFAHTLPPPVEAPMPPSRFSEQEMHVISGAFKSSRLVEFSRSGLFPRIPSFFAFFRTLPWESSVLCPSLRRLQPQRLWSLPALRSHFPPAPEPSELEGTKLSLVTGAAWPLRECNIRGVSDRDVASKIHDFKALSNPLVIITSWPGKNSTLLMPPETPPRAEEDGLCAPRKTPTTLPPPFKSHRVTSPLSVPAVAMIPGLRPSSPAPSPSVRNDIEVTFAVRGILLFNLMMT